MRYSRVLIGFLSLFITLLIGSPVAFSQTAGNVSEEPLWLVTPTISPDGQQIAFCYQGVLHVVPVGGGTARALTTPGFYAMKPVFSPDGKWIAYGSDRFGNMDVFLVAVEGGQPKQLTRSSLGELPQCFTPAGDSIIVRTLYMPSNTSGALHKGVNVPLYRIPLDGSGREQLFFPKPAANVHFNANGFIFDDVKGNEDPFRKHHTSSVARDLWYYNRAQGKLTKVTTNKGEDRNGCFTADGDTFYFLSEREGGSFNIYRSSLSNPERVEAVTRLTKNPVRELSISKEGTLCFLFEGRIHTLTPGGNGAPKPVSIKIVTPNEEYGLLSRKFSANASSARISPEGSEVAFVSRGDVYVVNVEHGVTRRITNTPEMERTVSWGGDGRSLIYDAERDGSWNLYITKIKREEEKGFAISTELIEEPLLVTPQQTFQPVVSPDGKEVAFLEDRTKLKVINIASKAVREITNGHQNYSYSDGDLSFAWSPDSKWLVLDYNALHRWPNSDIGIVSAAGGQPIFNLTQSGYTESSPQFAKGGEMLVWFSDRYGLRSHASWGAQGDVMAFFTTQEAYDEFHRSDLERAQLKEDDAQGKDAAESDKKKDKKGKKDTGKTDEAKSLKIEFDDPEYRMERLTGSSGDLSGAVVTPDGESLYYIASVDDELVLYKRDLHDMSSEKISTLPMDWAGISLSSDGKYALIAGDGKLIRLTLSSDKQETVGYSAKFDLQPAKEREYMYQHVVRQVRDKFYRTDLHGVDWGYYSEFYAQFLPHINNNYDFADLLSELLGELNASHTGSGYSGADREVNASTASLGVFFDRNYTGEGVKVTEVLKGGPFAIVKSKMVPGAVITHVDGEKVTSYADLPRLLNGKRGDRVRVDFQAGGAKVSEVVKPISQGVLRGLFYTRWVEQRRAEVDKLSKGRLGYVHIQGMNTESFRTVYKDLFGRFNDKEGVVIDTRYNGGGHLHEDIEVLFSGKKYLDLVPREELVSEHPRKRWKKPSVMLISESNYSNAHGTPWVYKGQGLGKLVGQPVPGTMTSVWWETLIDPSLYFGVPIVGYIDENGNYLENQQLEPDVNVMLDYLLLEREGRDTQIEKAVEVLLQEVDAAKGKDKWNAIDAKYKK